MKLKQLVSTPKVRLGFQNISKDNIYTVFYLFFPMIISITKLYNKLVITILITWNIYPPYSLLL